MSKGARTKEKILSVQDLRVQFDIREEGAWPWQKPLVLKAVDGIDLDIYEGETLGVVGESGCGKSTLARALIGMLPARTGRVVWLGKDLTKMGKKRITFQATRVTDDLSRSFGFP